MNRLPVPVKPRGEPELKFGDVLLHPYQGRGMVYAIAVTGLPMIAYENECVLGGITDKVRVLGSIFDLPLPAKTHDES